MECTGPGCTSASACAGARVWPVACGGGCTHGTLCSAGTKRGGSGRRLISRQACVGYTAGPAPSPRDGAGPAQTRQRHGKQRYGVLLPLPLPSPFSLLLACSVSRICTDCVCCGLWWCAQEIWSRRCYPEQYPPVAGRERVAFTIWPVSKHCAAAAAERMRAVRQTSTRRGARVYLRQQVTVR